MTLQAKADARLVLLATVIVTVDFGRGSGQLHGAGSSKPRWSAPSAQAMAAKAA